MKKNDNHAHLSLVELHDCERGSSVVFIVSERSDVQVMLPNHHWERSANKKTGNLCSMTYFYVSCVL